MQGGLPPAGAIAGDVVEIACDESGFSGGNLLDPATPVIAHASVDLSVAEAVEVIAELRAGFRFSPHELKSGRLLRASPAVEWLRTALAGRSHVHVIDKEFHLVVQMMDLLLAEPSYARLTARDHPAAVALHRAGRSAGADWTAFLASFVRLVRMKRRGPLEQSVDQFFAARDALLRRGVEVVIDRDRVWDVVTRLDQDDRSIPPPLEPLLPALARTVLTWSAGRRQVLVTHDEQSALTADRLTRLRQALAGTLPHGASPLAGLVMADSRADPRIQLADLLAGSARRRATV